MKQVSLEQFHELLKAQGVKDHALLCFVCPMCGTVQSGADLIAAGAGKTFDEVEKYLGFSCVGRFTHGKPPPAKDKTGTQDGCNWTLGGLFQLHELEVITPDGVKHPRFEPATLEEAAAHLKARAVA